MMIRKPAAELEKFQQNRDADTSPGGAVGEQSLLGLVDRPMLDYTKPRHKFRLFVDQNLIDFLLLQTPY